MMFSGYGRDGSMTKCTVMGPWFRSSTVPSGAYRVDGPSAVLSDDWYPVTGSVTKLRFWNKTLYFWVTYNPFSGLVRVATPALLMSKRVSLARTFAVPTSSRITRKPQEVSSSPVDT